MDEGKIFLVLGVLIILFGTGATVLGKESRFYILLFSIGMGLAIIAVIIAISILIKKLIKKS